MSEQNNRPDDIDIDSWFVDKLQPISVTEDIIKLHEEFSKNSAKYLDELIKSIDEGFNDEFPDFLPELELSPYIKNKGGG